MGPRFHPLLRLLAAMTSAGALIVAQTGFAQAQGLVELTATLTLTKTCAGLSGKATLNLTLIREDQTVGSRSGTLDCGASSGAIEGLGDSESLIFLVGDKVTITEQGHPSLAVLPVAARTVTLTVPKAVGTNAVTIADPAAVSIKKTCADGVTGTASFVVTDTNEDNDTVSVDVACGATVPVPLKDSWDTGEDLVIHESVPPSHGQASDDVTVRIPSSEGQPQVATFANALVVTSASASPSPISSATPTPTASPTPSPTPTPRTPVLAQTGGPSGGDSAFLLLLVAATSATLLFGGFTIWRRRRA